MTNINWLPAIPLSAKTGQVRGNVHLSCFTENSLRLTLRALVHYGLGATRAQDKSASNYKSSFQVRWHPHSIKVGLRLEADNGFERMTGLQIAAGELGVRDRDHP
jgi:hypothetical protein